MVVFALVNAEELGVNSKNIDDALKSSKPAVQRLLGKDGDYGVQMGLTRTGPHALSGWSATTARSTTEMSE